MTTARLLLTSCFCLLFSLAYAQIPPGYYDAAAGLQGEQLKASLNNIIDGHIEYPYSSTGTDVWDILKETDRDPNNPNNVIGIYSGFSMDAAKEYDSGNGWNREHVWAKSYGDFGTTAGAGTDVHHIRAEDISTNSARNNRNFDEADFEYIDGSGNYSGATACYTSSTDWIWEPREQVKGDVARMIFYMATRYEGENGEVDLELTEVYQDRLSKTPNHARLSVLVQWHLADPVDDLERQRNEIIYSYQGNRNPYIDHPEWVCQVWEAECTGTPAPTNSAPVFASSPVATGAENQTYTYSVSVTDANGDALSLSAPTLPYWLTFTATGNGTATLSGTPAAAEVGAHSVVLAASDGAATTQQSFTITVEAAGGTGAGVASELFLSEYTEGSSYNKGLEIANFTGQPVDLSSYSLKKQTNGAGDWSAPLSLSGTLAHGEVYVVVHSSAAAEMQAVADLSTGTTVLSFNGNDALALFKNEVLLDIIGTFNGGTSSFAADVTLLRNATVSNPSSMYQTSEWSAQATNSFADLGQHTFQGGGSSTPVCTETSSLAATQLTSSSVQLNWQAVSGAAGYNVRYRASGSSSWVTAGASGNSLSLSSLSAATTYEFAVQTDCGGGNTSAYTASVTFRTADPVAVSYCDSYASNSSEEWIQRLRFASIDNTSGNNGGYGDFTGTSAAVTAGASYSISIYPAWYGRSYSEAYGVWIDYNGDGDFADAGELAFSQARTKNTVVSGSITIPATAITGNVRMRVSMKYNKEPGACEVFSYGEVEDYTVSIGTGAAARFAASNERTSTMDEEKTGLAGVSLYPNPARGAVTVALPEAGAAILQIYTIQGKVLLEKQLSEERNLLDITVLAAGVYQLVVKTETATYTRRLVVR